MSRSEVARLDRCLEALARMVREERFAADEPSTGVEIELALVDARMRPAMLNHAVLDRSASDVLTTELGRWTLEVNLPPRTLDGTSATALEREVADAVVAAGDDALGVRAVTIGVLPTLDDEHLDADQLTEAPRYTALAEQLRRGRGEPFRLDIAGPTERLRRDVGSIAAGAAGTSLQLHLQLTPATFAAHWNAAQAIAGVQVALAANSPFLLGHRLWAETRIPLCTQAMDGRSDELRHRGARPRVWFGDRWASSAHDLFAENVRHFGALLPPGDRHDDEDPLAALDDGRTPRLDELRRHNGTVWRWNRPVYDVADEHAHLRLENRVLPAGPTAVDAVANAMFFYGAVRALATEEPPVWARSSFAAAGANLLAGARSGLDAVLTWPDRGEVPVAELVLDTLVPLAHRGLASWGVDAAVAEHYLSVIEGRCRARRTGAGWQVAAVAGIERAGADRATALHRMLERYLEHMASNAPVHTWPVIS